MLDSVHDRNLQDITQKHQIKIEKYALASLNKSVSIADRQVNWLYNKQNSQVTAGQYRRQELDRKFGRSGIANNDINFRGYVYAAKTLDVQTRKDSAVFYSGKDPLSFMRNRQLARNHARDNGLQTLEEGTVGGRWLNKEAIFNRMSYRQAMTVWGILSRRYAEGTSGRATAFVRGTEPDSIYMTQERPALIKNKTEIIQQ